MKQTKVPEPVARNEAAILGDIATESEHVLVAQQEIEAFEARRTALLATESLDKIHALADAHARTKLGFEIAGARLLALNEELNTFRLAALRARIKAAMEPLAAIDIEERQALSDYEQHAAAVADALTRLGKLQTRREEVSQRVHQINGSWIYPESKVCPSGLSRKVELPSVGEGGDFWPQTPYSRMLDEQAQAASLAAAAAEYREGR